MSRRTLSQRRRLRRAELKRERCEAAYKATKSHFWLARLRDAVTAELKASTRAA